MLIWLDYALSTCLRQLLGRTLARIWDQQELWAGNRESFQKAFFNRDSIFLFAIKMHKDLKNSYPAALAQPEFSHLKVVRLRSPGETACWLRQAQLPEAKKMGSRVI